jgi:hypothetical protein
MFKKAFQQGRSERRGEAYSGYPLLLFVQRVQNIEPLREARTKLEDCFNILLVYHRPSQCLVPAR